MEGIGKDRLGAPATNRWSTHALFALVAISLAVRAEAGSSIPITSFASFQTGIFQDSVGLAMIGAQAALLAALVWQGLAKRRAEDAQFDSFTTYSSVADALEERVATLDSDGKIISANRAWHEFARTRATSPIDVGTNYVQVVERAISRGRDDAKRTLESLKAVLHRGETARKLEYFGSTEEQSRYEMRVVSLQRRDGGAVITIQDITDRWQSQERVRVALESLAVATILVNADGLIDLVNAEAEHLFGYPRAELLGQPMSLLVRSFNDLARRAAEDPPQRLNIRPLDPIVTGRRKNGSEVPLQFHVQAISSSTPPLMLASMLDLTERRRLDAEVQRHREETAHFGRLAVAGELSAAIAHELNQPLTGIMTNCQAAQRLVQHRELTKDEMTDLFGDIVADARRAGEVIGHLRLMLRKAPREMVPLSINDTVKGVQRLVAHDLALRATALDLELAEDLPSVAGDRIQLQQVVINLVLNAADAMAQMPPEARRMVLRSRPGINHTIELELRDSGPGIPPDAIPRVFQPFFTTKKEGMGMGLSIVRSIVEFNGGRVTCGNSASGAVFTVSLPVVRDDAA
jgi:two-component system sensor kinase FixL